MLDAGVNVVRLNASHADRSFLAEIVSRVRELAEEMDRSIGILLDLRGPKIRVGRLRGGKAVELAHGVELILSSEDFEGDARKIPVTYAGLVDDVEPGDMILLDDGLLELCVLERESATDLRCRVVVGGPLKPNKGINVPGRALSTAAFDEKDLRDLDAAIELGMDFIALSFVRSGEDVRQLRKAMHERGGVLPIVAKIEKPQALDALEEILDEADGIMVARGDLGVEVPPERVPSLQKRIIASANARGLPVITATQMLESMIEHARPTRAEASDVANAIFDGTDAVMLSGETATGRYPVEAVRMMSRIAVEAEGTEFYGRARLEEGALVGFEAERRAVAVAARRIAQSVAADCIVVYTLSGTTALLMSKMRSKRSVLALCPDPVLTRRMALWHGIVPRTVDYYHDTDDMLREGDRILLATGLIEEGDHVVVLGGTRQFASVTSMIQVRHVQSDPDTEGASA
jgi:pyruvate kinase